MRIGYFLSSEEFDPRELVKQARMAEDAGFFETYASEVLPRLHDTQAPTLTSAAA